jgi:DNA repair photolyase
MITGMPVDPPHLRKGRGALSNPEGRFESRRVEPVDDGWSSFVERSSEVSNEPAETNDASELPPLETIVRPEPARSIITHNNSPDVGFEQSINPYRGCEHGCVYCFARPNHSYVNLSPGLDFETKLFYKQDAAQLLEKELRRPKYVCKPINIGASTDPYQPIEKKLNVTRSILEVMQRFRHPITIITKGHLVVRDIDILAEMARDELVTVYVSITTLDAKLKRGLEPRAPSPAARLGAVKQLTQAGIPVGVMMAPIIPAVNDHEIEHLLEQVVSSGAQWAGHVLLRLPYEVKDLFKEWLEGHMPLRAGHVMSLIRQMRGGYENDPRFGSRMRGAGPYAQLITRRFEAACARLGLNQARHPALSTTHFRVPPLDTGQLQLL